MTQNQIRFAEHRENQRHNRVTEEETQRHNVRTEQEQHYAAGASYASAGAAYASVAESARHNRNQELINWYAESDPQSATGIKSRAAQTTAEAQLINASTRQNELVETTRSHKSQEALSMMRMGVDTALSLVPKVSTRTRRSISTNLGG